MPGKRITAYQVGLYMEYRQENSQIVAAAKAGFCERSARNIEQCQVRPVKEKKHWKTRKDPFEDVWEQELVPLLKESPTLQAKTLLEYLQQKYQEANAYPDNQLRTLQRRVKSWRAVYGPEQEVIFRQNHYPAEQGISDFTHASSLNVTINGGLFKHLLYHYRLTFSGWEYAQVVLGGESFTALAEGIQNALWMSGGVPNKHRTDSLSAAYKNLADQEKEEFTENYGNLCSHYGMEPTRNNKGVSHENGTIESANRHLKSRLNQALMLRGSRDFSSVEEYKAFLRDLLQKYNKRIEKRYFEERTHLKPLPERKTIDYTEERVQVTSSSTIYVKKVLYSVPSRLIGMSIKMHIYDDRLECFVGADRVATLVRKRGAKGQHQRSIDYRHVVGSLARKPQAFKNYIYKEEMFPTFAFRQAWYYLISELNERQACREYVGILKEAAQSNRELEVNKYLEGCLEADQIPRAETVRQLFKPEKIPIPSMRIDCTDLSSYDQLLYYGGVQ